PLIAQGVIEYRPVFFGFQRVLADQPLRIGLDHRRIGKRRAEAFAPPGRSVVADDLHQNMLALVETHGGAFERRIEAMFKKVGVDRRYLHLLCAPINASSMASSSRVRS